MQFPNNQMPSQSAPFLPKTTQPYPNLSNLYQAFAMNSLYNLSFPPAQEFFQAKLYQSMFEKFLQSQPGHSSNTNINKPIMPPNGLMGMNPFMATAENPLMSIFYDTYVKLLKNQVPKVPTTNTEPINELKPMIPVKEEFTPVQKEEKPIPQPQVPIPQPQTATKTELSAENAIREMLLHFVKHVGTVRRNVLEKEGEAIHQNNEDLKEVFVGLLKKFLSSRKTKEEKIKYVLRKCFKFMKDKLLEENGFSFDSSDDYVEKLNSDKVEKMFFKHYFSEKCGKSKKFLTKNEITFIKDISMPFR
jgi:hypothetical protein